MLSRSRNWCVTINNPKEPYEKLFDQHVNLQLGIRYALWQIESSPSPQVFISGLEDIQLQPLMYEKKSMRCAQCYIQFCKTMTLLQVQSLFPGAHLECARFSYEYSYMYCSKQDRRLDGPFDVGNPRQDIAL